MSDFAAWKADASPDEASVGVVFDRRLYREFADLSRQLDEQRVEGMLDQNDAVRELAERLVEVKARIDQDRAKHTFVFRQIPYDDWREVAEAHPPTKQQKSENKYLDINPDTWPQAAIAATCHEPPLTLKDAEWLRQNLPQQEFQRLADATSQVNVGGSQLPKSVSSTVAALGSALKSTTPASEESLSPSSEDE